MLTSAFDLLAAKSGLTATGPNAAMLLLLKPAGQIRALIPDIQHLKISTQERKFPRSKCEDAIYEKQTLPAY